MLLLEFKEKYVFRKLKSKLESITDSKKMTESECLEVLRTILTVSFKDAKKIVFLERLSPLNNDKLLEELQNNSQGMTKLVD